jgi:hypothetical protein
MICKPARTDFGARTVDRCIWNRAGQAGIGSDWRGARRAEVLVAAGLDRARQGMKITFTLMKGSDLQADISCVYVDLAAARGQDSGPGVDLPSYRRAEGPAHEHMPHQRWYPIE